MREGGCEKEKERGCLLMHHRSCSKTTVRIIFIVLLPHIREKIKINGEDELKEEISDIYPGSFFFSFSFLFCGERANHAHASRSTKIRKHVRIYENVCTAKKVQCKVLMKTNRYPLRPATRLIIMQCSRPLVFVLCAAHE